jgi:cytochrome c oxidase cbb3-type subunit I
VIENAPETNDIRAFEVVTRHSLLWLVTGNLAGVLLAVLLLVPSLGTIMQPFTYGRWVTVHLNASLYGWASIPLIGLLFQQYLPRRNRSRMGEAAVMVWSGVLLFSLIGWLTGHTSGKLFMEWSGPSRWAVLFGMGFLALSLWVAFFQRLREDVSPRTGKAIIALKVIVLLALSLIPAVMYLAANPALYPPVNPDSGGATGGSLLGSTLAIVAIYWVMPFVLGLKRDGRPGTAVPTFVILIIHFIAFTFLDHSDQSHRDVIQIIALSSLLIWVPLLIRHFRRFEWPAGSRPWLLAFACWGAILSLNGVFTFLPGILDHWKFTNALVAHVHIAMAGMVTSFNVLVLVMLNHRTSLRYNFSDTYVFWFWQIGTIVHALSLLAAGSLEAMNPGWLFTGHPLMNMLYLIRLFAGLFMLAASLKWLWLAHCTDGGNYESI